MPLTKQELNTKMFLDKKNNLANNCPDCKAKFTPNKGAACLVSCPAKKLEVKHQKLVAKMLVHCLPKQKISWECPQNLSAKTLLSDGWGWTDDIQKIIYIPWYTLRSKTEFFDTISHEVGHIKAYQKKFSLGERSILKKLASLYEKREQASFNNKIVKSIFLSRQLNVYRKKNQKLIDKYNQWGDGHDHNPWYQEYCQIFKKLINSSYSQYAYGNKKPRSHGFDNYGRGKYRPKIKIN
ncbi:hypothetical protein [endosymbiont GvMRE of Glomus versiforme]|uniref:hypothetical protein n=1 Tax=endosymbiont GvMRE of Glomus versiforme TaxID=2039283 RepID=UPI000ED8841D|nr:hypothetical protein [endosymbiont GvMRE of Glomus versiforme]RHZ36329.1 hypothetical protein GvMRE_Ic1g131 [endosymbiont GvMRE of Glomus versiforme]